MIILLVDTVSPLLVTFLSLRFDGNLHERIDKLLLELFQPLFLVLQHPQVADQVLNYLAEIIFPQVL